MNITFLFIFGKELVLTTLLTLITLGFLKVVFSGGKVSLIPLPPYFIFQEELIQYHYNFMQLLNNLFKVG